MSWTAPFKDAALKEAAETGKNWLKIAARMRAQSGASPKATPTPSKCAKLAEADCKADAECSWRKGGTTKKGKTRGAFCAKKGPGRPGMGKPHPSPKTGRSLARN